MLYDGLHAERNVLLDKMSSEYKRVIKISPHAGSMAGGFFATSISGKMPAGIEASLSAFTQ